MQINLTGRTALITGGSLGLGLAMAKTFAAAGANVALAARNAARLEAAKTEIGTVAAAQARAAIYPTDVSDPVAIAGLADDVVAEFGHVDILVNNAGTSQTGNFADVTDAIWQADLDLKLFAAIRLCRRLLPGMQDRGWGRVINVLNSAAKAPRAGSAPTSVSRAAGMALTKVLAGEYAAHGVTVNAMCTGIFLTNQWHAMHERAAPEKTFEDFVKERGAAVPVGRIGDAAEFAHLACFLVSEQASYITGTAINADGGLTPVV